MWRMVLKYFPSIEVWFGALASVAIPLLFTWVLRLLRQWGNPPWLQKQGGNDPKS